MRLGTFRFTLFRGIAAIATLGILLPFAASAQTAPEATPTPTATATAAPVSYTPKSLKGKCNFPSDKLIEKALTEKIKVDLAARGIAKPAVRVKLSKFKPEAATLDLGTLAFSAAQSGGALEYIPAVDGPISLGCSAQRTLDISVAAKVDGKRASSLTKTQVNILGALK